MEADYLISGAGIAGMSLALELDARGRSLLLVDPHVPNTSSKVAAGLINPIVPRLVSKTWNADHFFAGIEAYYRNLEAKLNTRFYTPHPMFQIHASEQEQQLWRSRATAVTPYVTISDNPLPPKIKAPFGSCEVHGAGRLNVAKFCSAAWDYLIQKHIFIVAETDYSKLIQTPSGAWDYEGYLCKKVVFCEGWKGAENPWFSHLPFAPSGGDILELDIPELAETNSIFKQKQWLVPNGESAFLAGSTFVRDGFEVHPVQENQELIISGIQKFIEAKIQVKSHQFAIRPTTKHRRPFLGQHPVAKGLYVFNGLGTKGSSLATWLAPAMACFMEDSTPLPAETDISSYPLTK